MDPNQWAYNQAYRLNAAGGIPTNSRFELPFMEQGTPQVQGTAVHPSLAQSRGLGALPNYGHPAFGTVSQFLENMQSLGTPIAGTTSGPYKTVTVGQPSYTLETPPRTTEQRLLSAQSNPVTSISPPKTWELSSFIPSSAPSSNPFSVLPQDLATFNSALEPPPAHSRNPPSTRASTIQRNPYQKEYMDPPLLPVTAHSGVSRSNHQGGYSSLAVEREPPVAHSHGNQFCSYGPQQISSGNSHQRSHQSSHLTSHQTPSMRSSTMTSNYPSSPQLAPQQQQQQQQQQHQQSVQETYSYGSGISNNTFVDTKMTSHIDTSPSLSYEAVSPAGTPTLTSGSAGRDSFTPMSLQDLADISSNQERLPLQRQQQSQTNTVTTWAGNHNLHRLPKQQESQSALSSPHSHLGSPHMVMSEHSPLHQPSPNNHINVGSPQVGMSLGSPQSGSSSINPPPIVTAVPDSTTKPRKRSRKKKEEKPEVYESPISIPQQPVFPCPGDLAFSYNPKYTPMNFGPPPGTEVAPPPESIFMTNAFGNAFVNPNDAMGTSLSKVEGQMDYGDNMGMTPTKQSLMPPSPPVAVKEEVDEEFAHLVTPAKNTTTTSSSTTTDTSKSDAKEEKTSPGSTSSAFQNSFLSFLQGNKPETLSSVTNSNVQRPPMPKYVPDTRPIIPPEPKFRSRSDSFSPPPSKSKRSSTSSVKKSEMDVPSVTFSDDDDEEEGKVTKTVANFLDNTSGDEESIPKSGSAGPQVARRGRGVVKNKGRAAPVKRRKSGWDEDDDDDFNPVDDDMDEGVVEIPKKTPKKKPKAPSPIPMRERPSRRAKEKVEEKRKAKEEKKKRKLYGGDTDSDSPLEESSGDEKPTEKDYDSDRDPVWRPTELPNFIPVHNDSDDDGTGRKGRSKLGRRFRPLPSKSSRSKVKINIPVSMPFTAAPSSAAASAPEEMAVQPVPEPVHQPSDDDEEPVHRFMKGDFVIEKKDLTNYDSYPIWKIDAGRLIQKFEPIEQNGRNIHKALSTYSSWSDAIKHQFKAIKVRILQVGRAVGSEQVEVLEQYRPQPSEATDEEEDELMPFFNIYMQILISQALEPGFLAAINEEKDEYYHGPLKKIDALIDEGVEELEKVLNWKDIFKDHVILYPDCKVMERGSVTIQCQVTRTTPAPIANQAVLLAGEAYDAETLEPLPAKTQAKREYLCNKISIKHLTNYHGLKHYRNATYQNCLSKVVALKDANKDLENRDLLDQCLQNRMWVQKMFRDLRTLTKKATEKT